MPLSLINNMDSATATETFRQCCAASRWVAAMVECRPFNDVQSVYIAANSIWRTLDEKDILEAFSAHPEIGDLNSLREKYAATKNLAAAEQAAVASADESTLQALALGNAQYKERFGFIFIVCATGKSAAEILDILHARLPLPRELEIKNAAEEQRKITALRLQKLLRTEEHQEA
jgi:2-oxo-4-hydroxy-4-carboxy-5-ureidoimidazoline decarboxylase